MNLKWCAFTGALMLACVCATFVQTRVVVNAPGITTRWWDGTVSSVEKRYDNGKVYSITRYGDDGKTLLSLRRWSRDGALIYSMIRRPDGKLEEKEMTQDGKTLRHYALWTPDKSGTVIDRVYLDGHLMEEKLSTEDGKTPTSIKLWDFNGHLKESVRVLDNADQEHDVYYPSGKLEHKHVFKANGDEHDTWYFPDGKVKRVQTKIMLTGARTGVEYYHDGQIKRKSSSQDYKSEISRFDASGAMLYHLVQPSSGNRVISIYAGGKLEIRQTVKDGWLVSTEVFSDDKPAETLLRNPGDNFWKLRKYRPDGTLARVKVIEGRGKTALVTHQTDYAADGKTVVSDKQGGAAEKLDGKLFHTMPEPPDTTSGGGQ